MEEKRKERFNILQNVSKDFIDKHRIDKIQAGVDKLEKYKQLDEIKLLCSVFNCSEDEALMKDDNFLTLLICQSIENRNFDQRFNEIVQRKKKRK